jgi:hypothetical protein
MTEESFVEAKLVQTEIVKGVALVARNSANIGGLG